MWRHCLIFLFFNFLHTSMGLPGRWHVSKSWPQKEETHTLHTDTLSSHLLLITHTHSFSARSSDTERADWHKERSATDTRNYRLLKDGKNRRQETITENQGRHGITVYSLFSHMDIKRQLQTFHCITSGLCLNCFPDLLWTNWTNCNDLCTPTNFLSVSSMSWDCGLRYIFVPPVFQLGGVCALRDGGGGGGGMGTVCGREELTSRLGLEAVQRLAKDGCRLLQNHNYRLPDRNQAVSATWL